jgi:hypothetical protein
MTYIGQKSRLSRWRAGVIVRHIVHAVCRKFLRCPSGTSTFSTGIVMKALRSLLVVSTSIACAFAFGKQVMGATVWTEQKVVPSNPTTYAQLGTSAALDGKTAAIGAIGDDNLIGSVRIFGKEDGTWVESQKLVPDDGVTNDGFGYDVAIQGDVLVIASHTKTFGKNTLQGAAYVFENHDGSWVQTQQLLADDGGLFDQLGASAAIDGDTIVIGANGATVGKNPAQGAAYVFKRIEGVWEQTAKLVADDGEPYNNFGASVAIAGSIIFVGSQRATVGSNLEQGAVYQYDESGGTWMQTNKLVADDGAEGDAFGFDVAFDGTRLVVSAPRRQAAIGAAYIFSNSGGNWVQSFRVSAEDGAPGSYFGNRVVLDGAYLLVGANVATVDGIPMRGAAYLFEESDGAWQQERKFIADDSGERDFYGTAVGIEDGTALITMPHPPVDSSEPTPGAAYFYSRDTLLTDGFDG